MLDKAKEKRTRQMVFSLLHGYEKLIVMSPSEKFYALGYEIRVSGPNRSALLNGISFDVHKSVHHHTMQIN
jgi:hypothetical protein